MGCCLLEYWIGKSTFRQDNGHSSSQEAILKNVTGRQSSLRILYVKYVKPQYELQAKHC